MSWWFHVAVSWDGTNIRIYVNGNLVENEPVVGVFTARTDIDLGYHSPGGNHFFYGVLDDFRIYTPSLSDSQVANLYARSNPFVESYGQIYMDVFFPEEGEGEMLLGIPMEYMQLWTDLGDNPNYSLKWEFFYGDNYMDCFIGNQGPECVDHYHSETYDVSSPMTQDGSIIGPMPNKKALKSMGVVVSVLNHAAQPGEYGYDKYVPYAETQLWPDCEEGVRYDWACLERCPRKSDGLWYGHILKKNTCVPCPELHGNNCETCTKRRCKSRTSPNDQSSLFARTDRSAGGFGGPMLPKR